MAPEVSLTQHSIRPTRSLDRHLRARAQDTWMFVGEPTVVTIISLVRGHHDRLVQTRDGNIPDGNARTRRTQSLWLVRVASLIQTLHSGPPEVETKRGSDCS